LFAKNTQTSLTPHSRPSVLFSVNDSNANPSIWRIHLSTAVVAVIYVGVLHDASAEWISYTFFYPWPRRGHPDWNAWSMAFLGCFAVVLFTLSVEWLRRRCYRLCFKTRIILLVMGGLFAICSVETVGIPYRIYYNIGFGNDVLYVPMLEYNILLGSLGLSVAAVFVEKWVIKPGFFRLHLSTAIPIMIVAGLLIHANFSPVRDGAVTRFGWPYPCAIQNYLSPCPVRWDAENLSTNLGYAIATLGSTLVVLEFLARQRRQPV
jgi:hypothetical protein